MNDREMLKRKLGRLLKEPSNHELYNEIGILLYDLNDYVNAEKYFDRARELSESDTDVFYNDALALYALFDWRKAAVLLSEYLNRQPDDRAAIEKIADAYYHLGEYALAAKYECLLSHQGGHYERTE